MSNESSYVFFKPVSCFTFSLNLSQELALASVNKEDSPTMEIVKSIARFALTAFAVPFFTVFFVFYNACGVALKGSCAVISSRMESSFFNHRYSNYLSDVNRHIACTVKDLISIYFIGFLCLGYTFAPKHVEMLDNFITYRLIQELLP